MKEVLAKVNMLVQALSQQGPKITQDSVQELREVLHGCTSIIEDIREVLHGHTSIVEDMEEIKEIDEEGNETDKEPDQIEQTIPSEKRSQRRKLSVSSWPY